ncbi:MAG: NAD(+)/NADH kinase [Actinomycetota bacterium]|nr:NAD(+)/NADH kinase [Actinomycetota bacterium]
MARVAIVAHWLRDEAVEAAERAIAWLEASGHEVRVPEDDARTDVLRRRACPTEKLGVDLDLAVSLGGDGTVLRTVDLVAPAGVPVLGVNVGHLGYLTQVEPAGLTDALRRFLDGDYEVEARMTLRVEVAAGEASSHRICLNEAVLEKTVSGHTIHLAVAVNESDFFTCAADGLIVSTPTGSTAYNFSARGPIVSPRHRAIVMTPVSPHSLFDRSLVLGPEESVRVTVIHDRPATLVLDGQDLATLAPGDAVTCREGDHDALFVTFGSRNFHQILKAKFGLGR